MGSGSPGCSGSPGGTGRTDDGPGINPRRVAPDPEVARVEGDVAVAVDVPGGRQSTSVGHGSLDGDRRAVRTATPSGSGRPGGTDDIRCWPGRSGDTGRTGRSLDPLRAGGTGWSRGPCRTTGALRACCARVALRSGGTGWTDHTLDSGSPGSPSRSCWTRGTRDACRTGHTGGSLDASPGSTGRSSWTGDGGGSTGRTGRSGWAL